MGVVAVLSMALLYQEATHQSHYSDLSNNGPASLVSCLPTLLYLDVEGNTGIGMQLEDRGFDQQWRMFSFQPT